MSIYMGVNDVAKELGISPSTIKKYYLAVEEKGYRFGRNMQGQVRFGEHDIYLFKQIIVIKNMPGMSVQKAIDKLTADITDMTPYNADIEPDEAAPSVDMTVMTEQMKELKEMLKAVQSDLAAIKEEQASSRKLIESKPAHLEAMEKTNQMVKEVLDEMAAAREKKSFWSRIFKP